MFNKTFPSHLFWVMVLFFCIRPFGEVAPADARVVADPEYFYYASGQKIPLELSTEIITTRFEEAVSLDEMESLVEASPNLSSFSERQELPRYNITLFKVKEGVDKSGVLQTLDGLNGNPQVKFATPVFRPAMDMDDQDNLLITDEFIVKFSSSVSQEEIRAFNAAHHVEIVREVAFTEDEFVLRVTKASDRNALEMANLYYEQKGLTEWASPNFISKISFFGPPTGVEERKNRLGVPEGFMLLQNFPNPFNSSTVIQYRLSADSSVKLSIYNTLGKEVQRFISRELGTGGVHLVVWDGKDNAGNEVSSGVYFYRVVVDGGRIEAVKKMQLLR